MTTADTLVIRPAQRADAQAIAVVYNEGIEGREATFETEPRQGRDFIERIATGEHPVVVAELGGRVVGCGWLSPYSDRSCYAGVRECSVYVSQAARGRGIGTELCERLADEAERRGCHKLLGKLFPSNIASMRLVRRCRFREVGLHRRHGRLDGRWRDVLLVERLLGEGAGPHGDRA